MVITYSKSEIVRLRLWSLLLAHNFCNLYSDFVVFVVFVVYVQRWNTRLPQSLCSFHYKIQKRNAWPCVVGS